MKSKFLHWVLDIKYIFLCIKHTWDTANTKCICLLGSTATSLALIQTKTVSQTLCIQWHSILLMVPVVCSRKIAFVYLWCQLRGEYFAQQISGYQHLTHLSMGFIAWGMCINKAGCNTCFMLSRDSYCIS